ncbi:50S ribosomal protein L11 [Candidatus Peregrinibacteria bacterium]|jgi:large subunit ribosomal protein L11|nr:50S ribosomal protein L11 [Candidatus Peregrinibacteria bacterium]MBT7736985.1 50S ribosomal protein L11 [Candidatus Peregrinibacteria bacterium]
MAKEIMAVVKLQVPAGKANPAPPVGTALGPHGIQIQDFCTQFNNETKEMGNTIVPVVITIFDDRSFSFIMKSPPAAVLIKETIKLAKGSGEPHKTKVGTITRAQLESIAEKKMEDLNANDMDAAVKIIAGTCRSMGVKVEG